RRRPGQGPLLRVARRLLRPRPHPPDPSRAHPLGIRRRHRPPPAGRRRARPPRHDRRHRADRLAPSPREARLPPPRLRYPRRPPRHARQAADYDTKTDRPDTEAGIFRAAINGFGLREPPRDPTYAALQSWARHRRDPAQTETPLRCQILEAVEACLPGYARC